MQTVFTGQDDVRAIYRLGIRFVNWYLIVTEAGITIVDAGFRGHWSQVVTGLKAIGRSVNDIQAVILTHAHLDHVGFAERAHQEVGAEVWIHQADEERAAQGHYPIPKEFLMNMWRPGLLSKFTLEMFNGAMNPPKISRLKTFADGDTLPAPGNPQVLFTPGHTPGSTSFYLAQAGVLFSGDALTTKNPLLDKDTPPAVLPKGPTEDELQAWQSLHKLNHLERVLLLPGHGVPWYGPLGAYVQQLTH